MERKYIVITGGVLSGLGKGVSLASIGLFLSEKYNVVPIKLDGYLNVDPGTMNPYEHGEVFVLDDGAEVDMDFGHYERFMDIIADKEQSQSMGKIYDFVRKKERAGDYLGKTVQLIPHVSDAIIEKIFSIADEKNAEIVLIEIGGTVGDLENEIFIEAARQLKQKVGEGNIAYLHLTFLPIPYGVKEQKTKPTQQSVSLLHQKGIWPEFILCRCQEFLTENSIKKIALFCNVKEENIISMIDVDEIYKIPNLIKKQGLIDLIDKKLNLNLSEPKKLNAWNMLLEKGKVGDINVGIAGKYTNLEDSYASIVESLKHCSYFFNTNIHINWIDTSKEINPNEINNMDCVIIPGGFGSRGIEGKIEVIRIARINKIPLLGICYGLQLAVIEFLRNVCNIKNASSLELGCDLKDAAITLLDEQKEITEKGGTMRLGAYDAKLNESMTLNLYKELGLVFDENVISERHRHRYEVNPAFTDYFEKEGLKIIGKSSERNLVEFIEMDTLIHPFFVATQAHPELKSKLERPSPLFYGLIKKAIEIKKNNSEIKYSEL